MNCSTSETLIAASFDDVTFGTAVNPFVIIEITVSKDELTLAVILFDTGILIGVGSNCVALIAFFVFDTKLKEPVPFANILSIAPNDSLISVKISADADAIDDVICSAPKIL